MRQGYLRRRPGSQVAGDVVEHPFGRTQRDHGRGPDPPRHQTSWCGRIDCRLRATTRPILPSADLAATADFYAPLGFREIGRWPDEYLIIRDDHDIELHCWFKPQVSRWTNDVACWIGFEHPDDVRRLQAAWTEAPLPEPATLNPAVRMDHLLEFQLIDLHGTLLRIGAPRS
jgi:hypothetical protein